MSAGHEVEVMRRIFHGSGDGAFLCVGPDRDGAGCVEVYTDGKASKEFWGAIRLVVDAKFARLLAASLVACADEVEEREREGTP